MQLSNSLSIYIHIPFCRTRCGYCDFNTYAGLDYLKEFYVKSLVAEINETSENISRGFLVHTIYFGGGTPNLLPTDQIELILNSVRENFQLAPKIEISMEANPLNLSRDYLFELNNLGINRLSLGMQSSFPEDLKILGRRHTFRDVELSVANARLAGIRNINLDLIFGIPNQSLESFERTLNTALSLSPNHISLYSLTIEDSTPLYRQIKQKEFPEPDEDLAADMYILAMDHLKDNGFEQYEISNWSQNQETQCLHNLQYWRNLNYLGFGAGAHSHYLQRRWENYKKIPEYIDSAIQTRKNNDLISPMTSNLINLSKNDEISETMMMGLRLTNEGINAELFRKRFGISLEALYSKEINKLIEQNLIEMVSLEGLNHLRLTKKGRLLGNQVFMQFLLDLN